VLDPGPVDEPVEPVGDRVGMHRSAVRADDDKPEIVVASPNASRSVSSLAR
jgi:hypothetical protein